MTEEELIDKLLSAANARLLPNDHEDYITVYLPERTDPYIRTEMVGLETFAANDVEYKIGISEDNRVFYKKAQKGQLRYNHIIGNAFSAWNMRLRFGLGYPNGLFDSMYKTTASEKKEDDMSDSLTGAVEFLSRNATVTVKKYEQNNQEDNECYVMPGEHDRFKKLEWE